MDCVLMHKNVPVVDMEIDEAAGTISKINKAHDVRHLPPGINIQKTIVDRKALNDWWTGRSIPASRDGIREALEQLHIQHRHAHKQMLRLEPVRPILDMP